MRYRESNYTSQQSFDRNLIRRSTNCSRVVNGPTILGLNQAQAQKYKPEPGPNPKTIFKPKSCPKKPKVKLGLKNLAMLPSYFDYIFVHLRQK